MEISKSSLLIKYYNLICGSLCAGESISLCQLVRRLVGYTLLVLFVVGFIGFSLFSMGTGVYWVIAKGWVSPPNDALMMNILLAVGFFGWLMLVVFGLSMGIAVLYRKIKMRPPRPPPRPRYYQDEPIYRLGVWFRAKKEKICPIIRIVK